jgi:hypothetical protein
VWFSRS